MSGPKPVSASSGRQLPILVRMGSQGFSTGQQVPSWQRWLDKPQSALVCVSSWILASAIFVGMVALFGGPTQADASESFYATFAIAHGKLSCAYPPAGSVPNSSFIPYYQHHPGAPPLWPLISGAYSLVTRIGHAAPFPSQQALGTNCGKGYYAMYLWSLRSLANFPTVGIGYLSWFVLLAGVVALLRASGRGRSGWEVVGVIFIAALPIVWEPVLTSYHPQDLTSLGLALGASACALRRKWIWAGILIGLALTSQQFALLVAVPLFVVAPGKQRWRLLVSSAVAVLVVSLPFIVATSGRAVGAVLLGTGDSSTLGGTIVWESGLRGAGLVFLARVLPLLVSLALAFWAYRRLGAGVLEPIPLISLVATSLSLRVVFEEGLFGYKFLALAVMLVLLAVVRGQITGRLVAWLALVTLAFEPIPAGLAVNARSWADHAVSALPLIFIAAVLVVIVYDALNRKVRWYLIAWFMIAAWAFLQWPLLSLDSIRAPFPLWFWQLVLLPTGVLMAVSPLVKSIRVAGPEASVSPQSVAP
jgi:hypothetical protein